LKLIISLFVVSATHSTLYNRPSTIKEESEKATCQMSMYLNAHN